MLTEKHPCTCIKPCINTFINPFQSSVAFQIKTIHLLYSTKQMTGSYMKHNTGLKWVHLLACSKNQPE